MTYVHLKSLPISQGLDARKVGQKVKSIFHKFDLLFSGNRSPSRDLKRRSFGSRPGTKSSPSRKTFVGIRRFGRRAMKKNFRRKNELHVEPKKPLCYSCYRKNRFIVEEKKFGQLN